MGGGAPSVKQTSGCHEANARTDTCDGGAAFMPAAKPGNDCSIAFDHVVEAGAGGWDKNDFRLANCCQRHGREDLDGSIATDRASIDRRSSYTKTGNRLLPGEDVPEGAGVKKDFHRADGGGGESSVEKQDSDV